MISIRKLLAFAAASLTLLCLTLLAGCSDEPAVRQDYSVSRYDIQAVLADDGSAVVTETISLNMLTARRDLTFNIPYAMPGGASLQQVAMASADGSGSQEQFVVVQTLDTASNSLSAYYEMQDDGANLRVKLNYMAEAGSRPKIKLTYKLGRAVVVNADNAFLKREFFQSIPALLVGQASLTIQMPAAATDLEIWHLPVSLTNYSDSRPLGNSIIFEGQPAQGEQTMLLYLLMPETMFSRVTPSQPGQTWDSLTGEARQAAYNLEGSGTARRAAYQLIFILLALSVVLVMIIYWFYDREGAASFRHRYWYSLPADCPPAVMAVLLHKDRPGRLLLATLLDLVRRGELTLQGNVFSLPATDVREYNGFAAFEIFLVQWLFDILAHGTTISTAEIRCYARDTAVSGEMHKYYTQFRRLIDEEIERLGLLDHWRMKRGRLIAGLSSLLYIILTVVLLLWLNSLSCLLLLLPAAFLAVYAFILRRLTPAGRELYAAGRALARTIRCAGRQKNDVCSAFFSEMVPMSAVLAANDSLFANLSDHGRESPDPFRDYPLENYGLRPSARSWLEQVQSLGNNINSMAAMLSASLLMSAAHHEN